MHCIDSDQVVTLAKQPNSKDNIAAITMARNDSFFLSRWIEYYGTQLGFENLYIILDGTEQEVPNNALNSNLCCIPHLQLSRSAGDKHRIQIINKLATALLKKGYIATIGCDADEFIIVDPAKHLSLKSYILQMKKLNKPAISALGIDLAQNRRCEGKIQNEKSLLEQRRYGVLCSRYTKCSIRYSENVRWGSGFHRLKGHSYYIAPDLYLIHTGYCDYDLVVNRIQDNSRNKEGWQKHLQRRTQSIQKASTQTARDADSVLHKARYLQRIFRQPHALNKPLMPTKPIVIHLPERFTQVHI